MKKSKPQTLRNTLVKHHDAYVGQTWEHVKSGGHYHTIGVHYREADMVVCITYRCDGIDFNRPLEEFLDGRFRRVTHG